VTQFQYRTEEGVLRIECDLNQYDEFNYSIAGEIESVPAQIQTLLDTPTTNWDNMSGREWTCYPTCTCRLCRTNRLQLL